MNGYIFTFKLQEGSGIVSFYPFWIEDSDSIVAAFLAKEKLERYYEDERGIDLYDGDILGCNVKRISEMNF